MPRNVATGTTAVRLLARHHLLGSLGDEHHRELLKSADSVCYDDGEIVFLKGDDGDALYGIVDGGVRITAISEDGKEITLNIMQPDQFFGEIALLDAKPRTANAFAMGETLLLRIPRSRFLHFLEGSPGLAAELIGLLCERLRWTSDAIEDALFLSARARLAKRFLMLAEKHGEPVDDGILITLDVDQRELGRMIGVSRESVNTIVAEWRRSGLIEMERGRNFVLCDVEALRTIVSA